MTSKKTLQRPRLKIPYTTIEIVLQVAAFMIFIFAVSLFIIFNNKLPDKIPIHFNIYGHADNWGSRGSLITFPIIVCVIYIGMTLLEKIPHMYNYVVKITEENAEEQYRYSRRLLIFIKTEVLFMFACIEYSIISMASGVSDNLTLKFIPFVIAIIFMTIGYYTYKSVKKR